MVLFDPFGRHEKVNDKKDLIIIGAGPGGYVAAIRAAQLGLATTLVEKDSRLGGTCLLRGCIPTKALLETAYLFSKARTFKEFGITINDPVLDWAATQTRKDRIVMRLSKGIEFLMKKNKVDVVSGRGSLKRPGVVEVAAADGATREIQATNVLIATGSEPRLFPPFDIKHPSLLTSNEALEIKSMPETIGIIGAGAVGVEFACIFQELGSKVTLIELLPDVVPFEDPDVSAALRTELEKRGMKIYIGTKVETVTPADGDKLALHLKGPKGEADVTVDKLLVAVGRKPVTAGLNAESIGIKIEKGYIQVNELCETAVPRHYAIGDCIATPQLAHVASAEGKMVVEKIAGHTVNPLNYDRTPYCTYSHPEVSRIGLTETEARKRGFDINVGKFPFSALGKASIEGEREGFVKIVAEKKHGEIIGCSIIGPRATELIVEAASFMAAEGTIHEMIGMMHAHPTLHESMLEAAEAWTGHPVHM